MDIGRSDINSLLSQMRAIKSQTMPQGVQQPSGIEVSREGLAVNRPKGPDQFSSMLSQAIGSVNDTQQQAQQLATDYERGDKSVSLSQVMVASQKASVAFEATMQVRNKLVEAYKDVMNMPI